MAVADTRARHAFGSEANVDAALQAGKIDAFDILFLDEKKIGWIDKNGNKVIVEGEKYVSVVDVLPTVGGKAGVIYIFNNEAYVWNGAQCVPIAKPADLAALEAQVAQKVDAQTVTAMIDEAVSVKVVEF